MAVAYYYIDNTNGNNAHTGLRIPAGDYNSTSYNTIDSTADTTHFVDDALTGADDYINGSYFWNVTRGAGALITDFVAATDTATLGTAISGMSAGDSYYILDSWQTLAQYTTTSARTAGDIAYVRANQTHTLAASPAFDEDGSYSTPISLIGCSSTIDPYHDGSNTKPIIDGNNAAYYCNINADDNWYFKNLDFRNTNSSSAGCFYATLSHNLYFESCVFRDAANSSGYNVYLTNAVYNYTFSNCEFKNGNNSNVYVNGYGINATFINCTFNSGALTTTYGIRFATTNSPVGSILYLIDCTFGGTSAHATNDLYMIGSGITVYCKNVTFNTANETGGSYNVFLYEENADGAIGENTTESTAARTRRCAAGLTDTTVRSGGGASSLRVIPRSTIGTFAPFRLDYPLPLMRAWCPASSSTVTVYIRAYGTWGTYPTASELYVSCRYISDDAVGACTSTVVNSTEVLYDTTTWVAFTCTFTPHVAGYVDIIVYMTKYQDASTGFYIDTTPIVS